MKNYFFIDFFIVKIFFYTNFFTLFFILGKVKGAEDEIGECKIGKTKNSCLNNIIIFENTNGDIYLNENEPIIIFGTTFSNNDQRAFYLIAYENYRYVIKKDESTVPILIKNVGRTENKEIYNGDLFIYKPNLSKIIIFLFGTDESYIDILKMNQYTNDFTSVSLTDFLNGENKIIKGISSLFYFIGNNLIYGTVTMTKNNVSDYYISLYGYSYTLGNENNVNFKYEYKTKIEYDDIKGESLSCFVFSGNNYLVSCFYLNEDNNYTIVLAKINFNSQNEILPFTKKESIAVGSLSDPNDTNFYFLKAISLGENNCIYLYYSGESNDVPTFLFKTIDETNFILNDTYTEFPVIYLKEKYEFNNGIKYNDLIFSNNIIYFVSSSKNKEMIIIAYLNFYLASDNKLVIRYYTLELKKYYNMKVFHGFKTAIFSPSKGRYLSLGFDFSYSNNSSTISNAGFIIFSYPNISSEKEYDFIEYAFNNNTNYLIIDLLEDSKIENNIFGYRFSSIYSEYDEFFEGIIYFLVNSGKILESYYIDPDDSLIKIVIENGYFIEANYITFHYYLRIIPSDNMDENNEFCDEINDTYGDRNNEDSYSFNLKASPFNDYNIYIYKDLETSCDDKNCILCLANDITYCITCKGNYTFIYGEEYMFKKKKICDDVQDEVNNNTNYFSNDINKLTDAKTDELTNTEKFINDKLTYSQEIANHIKTDKLSNENYLLSDYESSNTNLIKTDEIPYKIESDSNNNQNKMLTDRNTEVNNDNTEDNTATNGNTEVHAINTVNTEGNIVNKGNTEVNIINTVNTESNTINNTNTINTEDKTIYTVNTEDNTANNGNIEVNTINTANTEDKTIYTVNTEDNTANNGNTEVNTINTANTEDNTVNKGNTEVNTINTVNTGANIISNTNTINTEDNIVNTEEISNKSNFSDIYKEEMTNIKEEQSDTITNKISNEGKIINDSVNSLSNNIYSNEISYKINTDELSENKKITDMNSFEKSSDIYKGEISNKIESSIISDTNDNVILNEHDSTSNKNIINTDKLTYINKLSTDNLLSNKYNLLTDISTHNNGITIEELINDKFKDINLSNEQLKKLYEDIKEYIIQKYKGDNTILNTNNVKIQISSIDAQKYSEELSNIDLGECGEILKEKYCKKENDSLIMLKFDIKPENETSTFVQYEIYEPISKIFLQLEECSKNKISIDVPVELDSELEGLYKWLLESGYNLFDPNDTFYNDICATYTTQNNTDILLYDRRMDIYQSTVNISLCQDGCDFQSYNTLTKKAKCDCYIQNNQINTDISELKFDKNEMLEQFYETLDNSNFRVLKCYKLVFNFKVFKKNIGCIFMTILIILFEILIILHLIVGSKKVNEFIQTIIKNKYFQKDKNSPKNNLNKQIIKLEDKNKNFKKYNNIKNNEIKIKKTFNKKISKEKKKANIKDNRRKSITYGNNLQLEEIRDIAKKKTCININVKKMKMKGVPPKRKNTNKKRQKKYEELNLDSQLTKLSSKKSNELPISQDNMLKLNEKKNSNFLIDKKEKKKNKKAKIKKLDIEKEYNDNNELKSLSKRRKSTMIFSPRKTNHKIYKDKSPYKGRKSSDKKVNLKKEFNNLNTAELNNLEYEKAILLDKRTYFQYSFSLLKKKHLILFTFLPTNDYNVMSLKISLFLVSFSLYLNVNGFFFNDDTMHKIYEESGVFNIIAQIPQILYSSIISSIINMILKTLSLSENDILKIKNEKGMINTVKKSKIIEKCIRIKFVLFFLISLLLMSFFWYFISCFCAVYNNTQYILFKDTLISFAISMIYPIGLNLIPGMFRIPSLRAKNKDKKCLYSFSNILALI